MNERILFILAWLGMLPLIVGFVAWSTTWGWAWYFYAMFYGGLFMTPMSLMIMYEVGEFE